LRRWLIFAGITVLGTASTAADFPLTRSLPIACNSSRTVRLRQFAGKAPGTVRPILKFFGRIA
jgi:hypothetical protein